MIVSLAHDSSSAQVRAAVFEGLNFVLDNRLSHGILKKLLPSLSSCLHDTSERVRASFAKMLLSVKKLRTIRFFDVVNLTSILDRLAQDRSRKRVASPLTALLLNSFFPRTYRVTCSYHSIKKHETNRYGRTPAPTQPCFGTASTSPRCGVCIFRAFT